MRSSGFRFEDISLRQDEPLRLNYGVTPRLVWCECPLHFHGNRD